MMLGRSLLSEEEKKDKKIKIVYKAEHERLFVDSCDPYEMEEYQCFVDLGTYETKEEAWAAIKAAAGPGATDLGQGVLFRSSRGLQFAGDYYYFYEMEVIE